MNPRNLNLALHPLNNPRTFNYGTWDVEAREWWDLLILGCYDGTRYFHWQTIGEFIDHILRKEYRHWRWFAHFGGRYDLNFVFDYVRKRPDLECNFYCSGSMVIQMTIRQGGRVARLCDSYRLLQASLRDLCSQFGVKHQKGHVNFDNLKYNRELIEYNELDCIGLHEVLSIFFEECGVQAETFASQSLKMFRHEFLKNPIWKPRPEVLNLARESYHGGRVEVFKREGHLTAYDVNSMFPHVMQQPVPVAYIGSSNRLMENNYGFVDATVNIPRNLYIAPLPVRLEKLYFPTGTTRGVWTTEELFLAEDYGARIQTVHRAVYFHTEAIFKEYVWKLYDWKRNATGPRRIIAKLLMNSLYGKFGQKPEKKVYCSENTAPPGSWPILEPDGKPSGFAYYLRTSNATYLLPHLSAAITSKARIMLMRSLNEASYYCDTDSIFTTDAMRTGTDLGQWDRVGDGHAYFVQPKLYRFRGEWKAKGLDRTQDIDAYVSGSPHLLKRARSIKEALRDGTPACAHVTVEKYLRQSRSKRRWVGDDTVPWNIKDLI